MANPLQSNSAGNSNRPPNPDLMDSHNELPPQAEEPSVDTGDWKSKLKPDSRKRVCTLERDNGYIDHEDVSSFLCRSRGIKGTRENYWKVWGKALYRCHKPVGLSKKNSSDVDDGQTYECMIVLWNRRKFRISETRIIIMFFDIKTIPLEVEKIKKKDI